MYDMLHFYNEGSAMPHDAVFQYTALTNEDPLDMPLPDNLGQILSGAGFQFTARGCLCSETYRCDLHNLNEY
jgi:hypothetical protein